MGITHSIASEDAAGFFLQLGIGLLVSVSAAFFITAIYLGIGGQLSVLSSRVLLGMTLIAAIGAIYIWDSRNLLLASFLLLIIYIASILISGTLYETNADGQAYHFQAVYALAKGWNPYHHAYSIPDDLRPFPPDWRANFFPKAVWLSSAIQFASGLAFESAKSQTLILSLACLFSLLGLLLKLGYSPIASAALALCASANPVMTNQIFTRYVDGVLAASLLLFVTFAILWVALAEWKAWIGISAALAFGINTKFSAVPMFAVLCAFTCLASYKQQQFWGLLSTAAILGAIGLIAIAGLGYAPYLRNLFEHGHIFYPLMGSDVECPGRCMEAEPLRALSSVKRFFFSLFAETHSGFATEMRLKLPFTFAIPEFRAAGGSETRIAGFGPFYSGALMVALATTCVIAFRYSRNAMVGYAALLLAAILISVAVLPENWWARYVPQLWLVPVVIAATAIYLNVRMLRIAGWLIVLTMLVNSTAAFAANVWLTAKRHRAVDAQIGQLRKEDAQNCVYFGGAQSRLLLFRKANLDVRPIARRNACSNSVALASYGPDIIGGEICRCTDVR
jgi:hypothetical protein